MSDNILHVLREHNFEGRGGCSIYARRGSATTNTLAAAAGAPAAAANEPPPGCEAADADTSPGGTRRWARRASTLATERYRRFEQMIRNTTASNDKTRRPDEMPAWRKQLNYM